MSFIKLYKKLIVLWPNNNNNNNRWQQKMELVKNQNLKNLKKWKTERLFEDDADPENIIFSSISASLRAVSLSRLYAEMPLTLYRVWHYQNFCLFNNDTHKSVLQYYNLWKCLNFEDCPTQESKIENKRFSHGIGIVSLFRVFWFKIRKFISHFQISNSKWII